MQYSSSFLSENKVTIFQGKNKFEKISTCLDSDFSLVAFFKLVFLNISRRILKNLSPFNSKSLLGCSTMMQHQKTKKKLSHCHTVALPFTLKSILRQKKNYEIQIFQCHAKL